MPSQRRTVIYVLIPVIITAVWFLWPSGLDVGTTVDQSLIDWSRGKIPIARLQSEGELLSEEESKTIWKISAELAGAFKSSPDSRSEQHGNSQTFRYRITKNDAKFHLDFVGVAIENEVVLDASRVLLSALKIKNRGEGRSWPEHPETLIATSLSPYGKELDSIRVSQVRFNSSYYGSYAQMLHDQLEKGSASSSR